MRYVLLLFVLLWWPAGSVARPAAAAPAAAAAQAPEPREDGAFGGPAIKYTTINGHGAFMVGGRGGWIINHSLILGGGGYGIFTDVDAPSGALGYDGPLDIRLGYGGPEVTYIFHPASAVHLTIDTLIGVGTALYVKDVGPVTRSKDQVGPSDTVFVWEPALGAEFNVTPWFRVSPALSYRLVAGVGQDRLSSGDLSGMAAIVGLKFGRF